MVEGVLYGGGEGLERRATTTRLLSGNTGSDRVWYYSQRYYTYVQRIFY